MKIAFLGSSEFSLTVLKALYNSNHKIVCVVTNVDKVSGRGHKVVSPIVKTFALENNIPVLQYNKVSLEGYDQIKSYKPDVLITASFGQILKQNILDLAPFGVINVHSSLLPKYRGSAPINWAIIKGETVTGVTIMKTNIGLDTGDIILKRALDILPTETAGELSERLSILGAQVLLEALEDLQNGKCTFTPQNEQESSYYPMLNKQMAKIDFNNNCQDIVNLVRGLNPWPICYIVDKNNEQNIIKVLKVSNYYVGQDFSAYQNGQVVLSSSKTGLIVKCSDGYLSLDVIQAPNSKAMPAKNYLNGKTIEVGTQF
ncbi:MAG: methionyl-tRNA formyltransferase [Clostridia bacterium]|nr:methionyl-tRNA formyltransferase [Clostridia bacterium]